MYIYIHAHTYCLGSFFSHPNAFGVAPKTVPLRWWRRWPSLLSLRLEAASSSVAPYGPWRRREGDSLLTRATRAIGIDDFGVFFKWGIPPKTGMIIFKFVIIDDVFFHHQQGHFTTRWAPLVMFLGLYMKTIVTLWLFNIAMGNSPFIEVYLYWKWWFSMAMLNNQMVYLL